MDIKELTKGLSAEQRKALMEELSKAEQQEQIDRRETYEALRRDFLEEVKSKVLGLADVTKAFRNWLDSSARGFYDLMREYGHLRNDGQLSFSITEGDFKLEVRSNKVKGFDERADVAAERLIEYLKKYISNSTKGADDPMYQLAMSLLARNRQGALDYKSISKLYELEDKFDGEYKAIMDLFRESNVVQQTAINYYFWVRDENKVWNRLEPSFCRL
ncbi:MAG: DUF3164 family protein [Bacteroidaceae bacterium]|nr:DUF3164 family protein [Bacteroidaceae bacterium]